jgi:4-hydroxy 2-oxovalerate aldolase
MTQVSVESTVLLDCTIRDGGYYNGWRFAPRVVARYLAAMAAAGVDVVEIGYRRPGSEDGLGPFAYCDEQMLGRLPDAPPLAAMVDASDYLRDGVPAATTGASFVPRSRSRLTLVRVAVHAHMLQPCQPIVETLAELGYRVTVNLLQASELEPTTLIRLAALVESWPAVECLYFADSLGRLSPASLVEVVGALRQGYGGPLGAHLHDNRGQALVNVLAALEAGVGWIDATVLGMGRGPGNAASEYVLQQLRERGLERYRPSVVYPLVIEDFEPLRRRHGWGPSLLYFLAAEYRVHPSYVQRLTVGTASSACVLGVLERLRGVTHFDEETLLAAVGEQEQS